MGIVISCLLIVGASILAIPVAIFSLEIVASFAVRQRQRPPQPSKGCRRNVVVLIPAHNERTGLLLTLDDVKSQLIPADRLLVVADNCTDDTASVASAAGAEVVERHDPANRGKGYALDFGLRHLASGASNVVIVIDADCRLAEGTIDQLARACESTRRPVQALNLVTGPRDAQISFKVPEFAWRVKNWLRPLGLSALNLPCQLAGTGMAFPSDMIHLVDLTSGSIVEDLKLGLDFALAGHPPLFCPSARVTSEFASSVKGFRDQRNRWEQGHIQLMLTAAPHLVWRAIVQRNLGLLVLALDLAVPPLSLLAVLLGGMFLLTFLSASFHVSSATTMMVSAASISEILLAASLAWLKCGRDILPAHEIFSIGASVLGKLPLYCQILFAERKNEWIRTDRQGVGAARSPNLASAAHSLSATG